MNKTFVISVMSVAMAFTAASAQAMGKKSSRGSSQAPACQAPAPVATPVRAVVVNHVKSRAFPLPNGAQVDLTDDMTVMAHTAATETGAFAPMEMSDAEVAADTCNTRLEIQAAVTALELNLYELKIKVGYAPGGVYGGGISSVNGEVNARVGLIAMDFSIRKCVGNQCTAVAATTVNQNSIDSDLNLRVDFGLITTGTALAQHPSFNIILRKLMSAAMGNIAKSPRIQELPWMATVREYDSASGELIFDAGSQSRILPNQNFVVYAVNPASGVCNVYKSVAYVRSTRVDPVSTVAQIEQSLNSREIQEGDIVMVKGQ